MAKRKRALGYNPKSAEDEFHFAADAAFVAAQNAEKNIDKGKCVQAFMDVTVALEEENTARTAGLKAYGVKFYNKGTSVVYDRATEQLHDATEKFMDHCIVGAPKHSSLWGMKRSKKRRK